MLYTEKEKHEIERVKEVFAEHLLQVFGRCCCGCFIYDGQRPRAGSSRSIGIGRN